MNEHKLSTKDLQYKLDLAKEENGTLGLLTEMHRQMTKVIEYAVNHFGVDITNLTSVERKDFLDNVFSDEGMHDFLNTVFINSDEICHQEYNFDSFKEKEKGLQVQVRQSAHNLLVELEQQANPASKESFEMFYDSMDNYTNWLNILTFQRIVTDNNCNVSMESIRNYCDLYIQQRNLSTILNDLLLADDLEIYQERNQLDNRARKVRQAADSLSLPLGVVAGISMAPRVTDLLIENGHLNTFTEILMDSPVPTVALALATLAIYKLDSLSSRVITTFLYSGNSTEPQTFIQAFNDPKPQTNFDLADQYILNTQKLVESELINRCSSLINTEEARVMIGLLGDLKRKIVGSMRQYDNTHPVKNTHLVYGAGLSVLVTIANIIATMQNS